MRRADALRHGWAFLWHLPLLGVFAARALNDAIHGLPLDAYERQGTREYYTRYAGLSGTAADARIADARRFGAPYPSASCGFFSAWAP